MFWGVWLHFAISPSPGRSHSLHGMSAYRKLLQIWIWGNGIKGSWKPMSSGWWFLWCRCRCGASCASHQHPATQMLPSPKKCCKAASMGGDHGLGEATAREWGMSAEMLISALWTWRTYQTSLSSANGISPCLEDFHSERDNLMLLVTAREGLTLLYVYGAKATQGLTLPKIRQWMQEV